ncbi:hypothetical protein NOR_07843 [Metarhizium rileyi]|uniref:Uncharacterized protein n=1 Tax=Metarhizium rileyi (strain RCEF 4871) TaxID=1649241 RepID=A0A166XC81_METRR|nr:hypothetical protein NOR_07843 [Metarhizium rileyi RCEF 4871]
MAENASRKIWVQTASEHYLPGGLLELGQILTSPLDPESALMTCTTTPFPEQPNRYLITYTNRILPVHNISKTRYEARVKENTGELAAVFLSRNQVGSQECRADFEIYFKNLYVDTFEADISYVKTLMYNCTMNTTNDWLEKRRRLYVVTGLFIAEGTVLSSISDGSCGHDKGGVTGDESQAAASDCPGVPSIYIGIGKTDKPYIFAYRLHEVFWKPCPSLEDSPCEGESFEIQAVADEPFDGSGYDTDLMS